MHDQIAWSISQGQVEKSTKKAGGGTKIVDARRTDINCVRKQRRKQFLSD